MDVSVYKLLNNISLLLLIDLFTNRNIYAHTLRDPQHNIAFYKTTLLPVKRYEQSRFYKDKSDKER